MDDDDSERARRLLPILEKAGRLLFNGFPIGVGVADAMIHDGSFLASTSFGAASARCRSAASCPVCCQNIPATLMPDDLKQP